MSAPNVIPAKAGIQYAYCASLSAARPSSSLKPRGNAATGAPFAGGVLDSRLRGNDGSIHTCLADLQGQTFLPVLAPVITTRIAPQTAPQTIPENVDKNTLQPLQILSGLLSEAELAELPEAPLMPFDVTSRFEQAIPFG